MDNVFDLSKKRSPHSDEKHILTAEYQRRYEETLDGGLSDIDRIRFSYTEFSSVIAKEITDVCQTFLATIQQLQLFYHHCDRLQF